MCCAQGAAAIPTTGGGETSAVTRRAGSTATAHVAQDTSYPGVAGEAASVALLQPPERNQREHPGARLGHRGQ